MLDAQGAFRPFQHADDRQVAVEQLRQGIAELRDQHFKAADLVQNGEGVIGGLTQQADALIAENLVVLCGLLAGIVQDLPAFIPGSGQQVKAQELAAVIRHPLGEEAAGVGNLRPQGFLDDGGLPYPGGAGEKQMLFHTITFERHKDKGAVKSQLL